MTLNISASRILVVGCTLLILVAMDTASGQDNGGRPEHLTLAPLDTSSPRATLRSFLSVLPEFEQAVIAYRAAPSRQGVERMLRVRDRAVRVLDLSAIPPALLAKRGTEALYMLFELVARIDLPNLEAVPDATAFAKDGPRPHWTIPNTEITIARVKEGPRAGEYLFSAETVARLDEFYRTARDLPFVRPMPIGSPRLFAIEATGWFIPPALVAALPSWSRAVVFDTPLWKLLAVLLIALLSTLAIVFLQRWMRPRGWEDHSPAAYARRLVVPCALFLLVLGLRPFLDIQLNLQGDAADTMALVLSIARTLAMAWAAYLTAMLIVEWVVRSPTIPDQSLDANLLRLVARASGLAGATAMVAYGANDVGLPVVGIVAGLGVGGLAVALAAQTTLSNLLGSLNLFADRPMRVGDFCQYGDKFGTIEHIGLRSSRIRASDRTVTTVPNGELAQRAITNYSQRDRMLFQKRFDLRHETTADQLRVLLIGLRELLLADARVSREPARVRLVDFGSSSIQIEIFAYVTTSNWNESLGVREELLLRIRDMVTEIAGGFAFPSQTIYRPRDLDLDAVDPRHPPVPHPLRR